MTGRVTRLSPVERPVSDPAALPPEQGSLALPDWDILQRLADGLIARSAGRYPGWGDIVVFAAVTAARIGEVSGRRAADIDTRRWIWTVRRQTTTSPGGLVDKRHQGQARPPRSPDP